MPVVGDPLVYPIFQLANAGQRIKKGERFYPPTATHGSVDGFCATAQVSVFCHKPRFCHAIFRSQAEGCHLVGYGLPGLRFDLALCPRLHETRQFFSKAAVAIVNEKRFIHVGILICLA